MSAFSSDYVPDQTPKPSESGSKPAGKPASGGGAGAKAQAGQQAKAQEGDYQFLPVQCPRCGLEGKVKISRLDRTFTCKQCRKVFHVTLDGTVSGEHRLNLWPRDPADMVTEEPKTWFEKWLAALPRPWQMLLGGICLLALGYGIKVLTEPDVPIPGELEARTSSPPPPWRTGEWRQVKRLAFPGTVKDLGRWYDVVRPKAGPRPLPSRESRSSWGPSQNDCEATRRTSRFSIAWCPSRSRFQARERSKRRRFTSLKTTSLSGGSTAR